MKLQRIVPLLIIAGCCIVALRAVPAGAFLPTAALEDTADGSGRKYYVLTFNQATMSLEQFNWFFTDNATSGGTDNGSSTGMVTIEQAGKTFAEASGAYRADGDFYNGLWEASEKKYSPYYETDMYTYYSFLFYGINLADSTLTSGILYSTVREESTATEPKEYTSIMPYFGFLVATSASAR